MGIQMIWQRLYINNYHRNHKLNFWKDGTKNFPVYSMGIFRVVILFLELYFDNHLNQWGDNICVFFMEL